MLRASELSTLHDPRPHLYPENTEYRRDIVCIQITPWERNCGQHKCLSEPVFTSEDPKHDAAEPGHFWAGLSNVGKKPARGNLHRAGGRILRGTRQNRPRNGYSRWPSD